MPKFLIVYSKSREKRNAPVAMLTNELRLNGTLDLMYIETEGFLFCTESKYAKSVFEDADTMSFVSGHISYDKTNLKVFLSPAETWHNFITQPNPEPEQLEGMFSAFHYNKQEHALTYINDKFGISPIFVYEDNDLVILSNDYQSLASFDRKVDTQSIAEYFTLGVTLDTKTFFKNIKNTEPATIVKLQPGKKEQVVYWEPPARVQMDIGLLAAEAYHTFTKINKEYHESGLVNTCLLTAGADSRLIISTLTQQQRLQTVFYTSNLSFLDPLLDQDVVGARAITARYELSHRVEKISFYENSFDEEYFEKEREPRAEQVYGGWHGGEFLGGYCFIAAPINKLLNYQEVNKTYKSVFNWWFRVRQKRHPFTAYKNELQKYKGHELLFLIRQMTGSFFTDIYGGTRGHWVQPFQLVNNGTSPFWDSRLLQLLLMVPPDELKTYKFYNLVLQHADKELTSIPSNSPLTNRADSVLRKMELGADPKLHLPDTHHKAYNTLLENFGDSKSKMYNRKFMSNQIKAKNDPLTWRWLDFEVWAGRYLN